MCWMYCQIFPVLVFRFMVLGLLVFLVVVVGWITCFHLCLSVSFAIFLAEVTRVSIRSRHLATMIARIGTWIRTLMMMSYSFVRRGVSGRCYQVKRGEALELEEFSWLGLPDDVVRLILTMLRYEDEAKFACVCKQWRDINKTRRPFYPVGECPLLIHVRRREEEDEEGEKLAIFHYYSPFLNKTFQVEYFWDWREYEIISAKKGALLIYKRDEMLMRLVDPLLEYSKDFTGITSNISFNGTTIALHHNLYVIYLINTSSENQVIVHLYYRREWALDLVYDNGNEPFYMSSNPVYHDGRFYCLIPKATD